MTLPFKDYLIGAGVLAVIGGGIGYTLHERSVGALNEKLKNTEATAHVQLDSVASTSRTAQEAASQAQAAKTQAMKQVAVSGAAKAKADSSAQEAADARALADRALADSSATVAQLRAALSELRSASLHDSDASKFALARADGTIHALMGVITADSVALTAEQRRSQSLQALNETLTREVALLKKDRPSSFGNVVRVVGWAGAGFVLGRAIK